MEMAYELADGTVREYPFGLIRSEFMGETTAGRVIFANPGVERVLGVTALESVGIMVRSNQQDSQASCSVIPKIRRRTCVSHRPRGRQQSA